MYLLLTFLILALLMPKPSSGAGCKALSSLIGEIRLRLKGGMIAVASAFKGKTKDEEFVIKLVRTAELSGNPVLSGLGILDEQFRASQTYVTREFRLWRLVMLRFGLILLVSVAGRYFIFGMGADGRSAFFRYDILAQVLASGLVAVSFYVISKCMCRFWFVGKELTLDGRLWAEVVVSEDVDKAIDFDFVSMAKKCGVPQLAELREQLREWARKQNSKADSSLTHLEELVPLLEIFGAGVPAFLNLLIPAVSLLS